jgi:hypothetical protein
VRWAVEFPAKVLIGVVEKWEFPKNKKYTGQTLNIVFGCDYVIIYHLHQQLLPPFITFLFQPQAYFLFRVCV